MHPLALTEENTFFPIDMEFFFEIMDNSISKGYFQLIHSISKLTPERG